jgi:hypothetical protein
MSVLERIYLKSEDVPKGIWQLGSSVYQVHSIRTGRMNLTSHSELSSIESLCSECRGKRVNLKNLMALNVARNHIISTKLTRARLFQSQIGE